MGRIDFGCDPEGADPAWLDRCNEIWSETQTECGDRPVACGYKRQISTIFDASYGGTPCSDPQGDDLVRLRDDSVVSDGADFEYENTQIHFLHGRADCTEAPILGTLYWEAITSSKSRTLAQGTPHRTISHANGARDLVDILSTHCR